ncbi:MAG TPA: DUF86 domain-containing protein [Dehalococcoidia bacterium]|nr:DUF86 domain-containing protein [Dehalococcoidia bacterium]
MENIRQFVEGMTVEDFRGDLRTLHAVAYNFGVLGEAASHVPLALRRRYPAVPWQEIRGMRNIVVHMYFGISVDTLWNTLTDDFPVVTPILERMLREEP